MPETRNAYQSDEEALSVSSYQVVQLTPIRFGQLTWLPPAFLASFSDLARENQNGYSDNPGTDLGNP